MKRVVELLSQAKAELQARREEVERLRKALSRRSSARAVAIIGSAVRLPRGIDTPDAFWKSLLERDDFHTPIESHRTYKDDNRWRKAAAMTSALTQLEAPEAFDAAFFRISPREARRMDPQHRILLELAWEATEAAAMDPLHPLARRGGVYIGLSSDDHQTLAYSAEQADRFDAYTGIGAHRSMAAGRIAAFLGWTGPAVQIDTACSSSLVAMHLARQAILAGDIDHALIGGCHLVLDPSSVMARGMLGALATDGRCKPFLEAADGYGIGEGAGMVLLREASAALRDGDPIIALIDGSAVNHNGAGAGITVPNPRAQASVMEAALEDAGADPNSVCFIEAHGTGTSLGDPIEFDAISTVYGGRQGVLPIGSVKANVGHLEAAAGVVSVIKAALALRSTEVPGTPGAGADSTKIEWSGSKINVPRSAFKLDTSDNLRRVAASSFGMSGTNCHIILSAPAAVSGPPNDDSPTPRSVLISAKSEGAARRSASRMAQYCRENPRADFGAVVRTLARGRAHFAARFAFVAETLGEAERLLTAIAENREPPTVSKGTVIAGKSSNILVRINSLAETDQEMAQFVSDRCAECLAFAPSANSAAKDRSFPPSIARFFAEAQFWRTLSPGCRITTDSCVTSLIFDPLILAEVDEIIACKDDATVEIAKALESKISFSKDRYSFDEHIAKTIGYLFCINSPLDLFNLRFFNGSRIPLPLYPFQREVFSNDHRE